MAITIAEVKKLAVLARLKLTFEEETRHAETISAVLDYMTILNEVDTTGVEPTDQVTGLLDVAREDEERVSPLRDKLLKDMPLVEGEELVVPGVFEE